MDFLLFILSILCSPHYWAFLSAWASINGPQHLAASIPSPCGQGALIEEGIDRYCIVENCNCDSYNCVTVCRGCACVCKAVHVYLQVGACEPA